MSMHVYWEPVAIERHRTSICPDRFERVFGSLELDRNDIEALGVMRAMDHDDTELDYDTMIEAIELHGKIRITIE